ncbi:MAG: hypothetical protein KAT30_02780, partial [Candidatus Krumholzibacteria bacterium]|nr:hypothetical protein [Candidatus Krumholzibacteria bacterium]
MNVKKTLNERISAVVIVFTIAVVSLAILYSIIDYVFAGGVENDDVFLEMPDPKYTECVKDTEYMRFHHWEFLAAMRDE